MKTIALRFGEHFAPECGTIAAHQAIIDEKGFVWYGKMGNPVSMKVIAAILAEDEPKILLIRSGRLERYWAKLEDISRVAPSEEGIPDYYRNRAGKFKTWFKVISFEPAPGDIMSKCTVASSGAKLSEASKHSMSPYFIINYDESEE